MRYITNCLIFLLVHYLPPQPARNRPGSPPSTPRPTPRQRTPPPKNSRPQWGQPPTKIARGGRQTPEGPTSTGDPRPETPTRDLPQQNMNIDKIPSRPSRGPHPHASLQNTHTPVRKPDAGHATDFKWQEPIIPPMRYLRPKSEVNTPCSIQLTVKSRINQKIESLRNDACVKYR